MGLLKNLLGGKPELEALADQIKETLHSVQLSPQDAGVFAEREYQRRQQTAENASPAYGTWGGDTPPAEENSFTYPGGYLPYFDMVFRTEFPEYDVQYTPGANSRITVFTFRRGGETALIVEIMNSACSAQKLRRDCARQGIPYLRYYYDHEGWWNTRSYVTERTRRALGG
ncbi:MAG TPA: hypothetical protein DDX71_07220 [Ruminococcus sp.]|nr:hypothetical protein [Ruminococcus sp.]